MYSYRFINVCLKLCIVQTFSVFLVTPRCLCVLLWQPLTTTKTHLGGRYDTNPCRLILQYNMLQKLTASGQRMFAFNKQRHGKKYYVRAIKVTKDYSWRKVLASFVVQVRFYTYRIWASSNVAYFSVSDRIVSQQSPCRWAKIFPLFDSQLQNLTKKRLSEVTSLGSCKTRDIS